MVVPAGRCPQDAAILHLHGGWFNWGSALAFRHLVGHIAKQSGVAAFVPDYRLAPEHPFPAALEDVQACYRALPGPRYPADSAVGGDSAGGNLALALLARTIAQSSSNAARAPVAVVVLSPVTDLTLGGLSWETRAVADPYFTRPQAAELIRAYLNGHNSSDPDASPLPRAASPFTGQLPLTQNGRRGAGDRPVQLLCIEQKSNRLPPECAAALRFSGRLDDGTIRRLLCVPETDAAYLRAELEKRNVGPAPNSEFLE